MMIKRIYPTFLPFIVLLLSCLLPASATTVHVNSITGNDTECFLNSNLVGDIPCRTIEHVYNVLKGQSSVTIYIDTDIDLQQVLVFRNVTDICIGGLPSAVHQSQVMPKVKCLGKTAGFYMEAVHNFLMFNLELFQCSALEDEHGYRSALIFTMASDIELFNTTLAKSYSSGIIFLECYGNIGLNKVHFNTNGQLQSCPSRAAGVLIENTKSINSGNYTMKDCVFHKNRNRNSCQRNESHNNSIHWSNSELGGGMSILISGNCSGNRIHFDHCKFNKNLAKWGGGLYVHFQDESQNNTVVLTNCNFSRNVAHSAGGGANVGFLNSKKLVIRTNMAYFENTLFVSNSAQYGGGIGLFSIFGDVPYSPGSNLFFMNCSWISNRAVISPAVDISPFISSNIKRDGFLPIPVFHDVNIIGNYIQNNNQHLKETHHSNSGVFLVTQFNVHFSGCILFSNNRFSALQAVSSGIIFDPYTTIHFLNNKGANGAAMAMYGFSYMSVLENISILFENNLASNYGGSIYYSGTDQHDFLTGSSCFMEYNGLETIPMEERNITFTFKGNYAQGGGHWIYADSFISCASRCRTGRFDEVSLRSITKCIGIFKSNESIDSTNIVMSSGRNFIFSDKNKTYSVIPGDMVKLPFNVTDDFNQTLCPLLSMTVSSKSSIMISRQYMLTGDVYPIGPPNQKAQVKVTALGMRKIFFQFNLETLQCPPGFIYDDTILACVCGTSKYSGKYPAVLVCNMSSFRAYVKGQYWAGYIPQTSQNYTNLYFAPCYAPICNYDISYLPSAPSELDQVICGENRRGIMCGECLHNYSVYYHSRSFSCKHNKYCHLGPLFYFLSEIIPVIILFLVVVMFDLTFTSGNVVGFIFFCQYLNGLSLYVGPIFLILKSPYRLFYGIFNFEYFTIEDLSYCLWKNFSIQDTIAFKYVTIFFAFALVLMLISILKTNRCRTLCKLRARVIDKASFVHGLSAFLVICYIQCSKTSFLLLKYVHPIGLGGKPSSVNAYSYYGGLQYFRDKHLLYGILAIFSLVMVTVLPPLVLLLHPLMLQLFSTCGLSEHWIVLKILHLCRIHKLIPFIDCFQSCYKDRYRFFAGLYFIYRVILLLCFITADSYYDLTVTLQIVLLLFLGLHAVVQPYKEQRHNILDALIFGNLGLINALSIAHRNSTQASDTSKSSSLILPIIQLILLCLPMIAFMMWAGFKLLCCIKNFTRNVNYEVLEDDSIEDREQGSYDQLSTEGEISSEEHRISRLYNYST